MTATPPTKPEALRRMEIARDILHGLEERISCAPPSEVPVLAARITAQAALLGSYTTKALTNPTR